MSPFVEAQEPEPSSFQVALKDLDMVAVQPKSHLESVETQDENRSTLEKDRLSEGTFEPLPLPENEYKADLTIIGTSSGLFVNEDRIMTSSKKQQKIAETVFEDYDSSHSQEHREIQMPTLNKLNSPVQSGDSLRGTRPGQAISKQSRKTYRLQSSVDTTQRG